MTEPDRAVTPPDKDEVEVVLLGPGYGESVVLHTGHGGWVIVDSCINTEGQPRALEYLESVGVDPAQEVDLIVATHWHDDHIRGMARLVEVCSQAEFCCANALLTEEFLAAADALEARHLSADGSGVRELHRVFTWLESKASPPTFAGANRRIHLRDQCEIWSLSPGDAAFRDFLRSVGSLLPAPGRTKTRVPSVSPNELSVVLWIAIGNLALLLGSDLGAGGWLAILNSEERPAGKASVFKVPHHGSADAYEPEVWRQMLDRDPFAVLTPWQRGIRSLPSRGDVQRILAHTRHAYSTSSGRLRSRSRRRESMVDRSIRGAGIRVRRLEMRAPAIRLRCPIGSADRWRVQTFGTACHLEEFSGP